MESWKAYHQTRLGRGECSKKQRMGILIIISLIAAAFIVLGIPDTCVADVATFTSVNANGTFQNGTFLMMSEATAQINITRNSYGCIANITCLFTIQTNVTQNTTLAFVFPGQRSYPEESFWSDMDINLNGTIINYTVLNWEELGWNLDNDASEYYQDWYTNSSYAVFAITIHANTTILIGVSANIEMTGYAEYYDLTYIVGSARTFYGDTHQRITINIIEYVPLLGKQFYPESHLVVDTGGMVTSATWNFQIREFEYDSIGTSLHVWQHTPGTLPKPTTTTTTSEGISPLIGFGAVLAVGVIITYIVYSKKQ